MTKRKGIVLAGGTGSRLWPITSGASKQLLPVHDKPMIYYPISVLMLTGIREIAIITTPEDQPQFIRLLGDGSQWGLNFTFLKQHSPDGLAQAYILTSEFLAGGPSALVLGDNIFYGHGLQRQLETASKKISGGTVFGYQVVDPERYGVIGFDDTGSVISLTEKPSTPASKYAITGLYFLDASAPDRALNIKPSLRGEIEITDLLSTYLHDSSLSIELLGRGCAWLDTGTHDSLLDAGNFVRTLQNRQGLQVGSPDEIAFSNGWIEAEALEERAKLYGKSEYAQSLKHLLGIHKEH